MSRLAERFRDRYYGDAEHPYRTLEREVARHVTAGAVVLDAGCGRSAPVLSEMRGKAGRLIGVDLVEFPAKVEGVELYNWDLGALQLPDATVDVIYSRSVMEHIEHPSAVFSEMHRVLKPGGHFIFLTANKWDYASVIASIVPNRLHPRIVRHTEGRPEEDVFPTQYKINTHGDISRLARAHHFAIADFRYLGQYPNYFMFNGALFLLGTAYHKLIERFDALHFLQGWILATLRRQ